MNFRAFAAILLIALSSQAAAKATFRPFEGRVDTFYGQGGTRETKNGIDFWALGTPPKRFLVIGVIKDRRGTGMFHGNAVGSAKIAKMVKDAGGDAVIVLDQNSQVTGAIASGQSATSGNQTFGHGTMNLIEKQYTTMVVVKYLPE